jgi:hypothetical protein
MPITDDCLESIPSDRSRVSNHMLCLDRLSQIEKEWSAINKDSIPFRVIDDFLALDRIFLQSDQPNLDLRSLWIRYSEMVDYVPLDAPKSQKTVPPSSAAILLMVEKVEIERH